MNPRKRKPGNLLLFVNQKIDLLHWVPLALTEAKWKPSMEQFTMTERPRGRGIIEEAQNPHYSNGCCSCEMNLTILSWADLARA